MALKKVLCLLACGDEPVPEGESFLASSILYSGQPLDSEVGSLTATAGSRPHPLQARKLLWSRAGKGNLGLLVEGISACSALTVAHNFTNWSQILLHTLQVSR